MPSPISFFRLINFFDLAFPSGEIGPKGGQKLTTHWHGTFLFSRFPDRTIQPHHPVIRLSRLFLLLPAFCGVAIAQERLLPPTFQPGFEYVIRSQQTVETVLGAGLPNSGKQVVDVTLDLVVSSRANPAVPGHRDLTIQLAKVCSNAQMGGLRMTYDSTAPDSAETLLGQAFRGVIGKSFQITLDPQDRVTEVKGQSTFEAQTSQFGRQVGVPQLIQSAMPMLMLGVPKEGIVPGQAWDHVKDSSMGPAGTLKAACHVTYATNEGEVAVFEYKGKLALDSENSALENGSKPRIGIENGILRGTMRVDKSKRFPVSGSGQGSLKMIIPNPAAANQPAELPITQRRSFELLGMRRL